MQFIKSSLRAGVSPKTVLITLTSCVFVTASVSLSLAGHTAKVPPAVSNVTGIGSIALFGATNNAGPDGANSTDSLNIDLKSALTSGGAFEVTTFSPRLPSVDRALNVDNTLTSADIQQPISDPTAALKIASVMGTDGYLLDEVDKYSVDPSTHAVSVTVSGYLYYTPNGAVARTFAVTGTATPASPSQSEAHVAELAVQNAVSQIVAPLVIPKSQHKSASLATMPSPTL